MQSVDLRFSWCLRPKLCLCFWSERLKLSFEVDCLIFLISLSSCTPMGKQNTDCELNSSDFWPELVFVLITLSLFKNILFQCCCLSNSSSCCLSNKYRFFTLSSLHFVIWFCDFYWGVFEFAYCMAELSFFGLYWTSLGVFWKLDWVLPPPGPLLAAVLCF